MAPDSRELIPFTSTHVPTCVVSSPVPPGVQSEGSIPNKPPSQLIAIWPHLLQGHDTHFLRLSYSSPKSPWENALASPPSRYFFGQLDADAEMKRSVPPAGRSLQVYNYLSLQSLKEESPNKTVCCWACSQRLP